MSHLKSISQIAEDVRSGKTTAEHLVDVSLKRIGEVESYRPIISVVKDRAKSRAKMIDAQVKKGENPGKLAGVPFVAKDNFLVFGADTTAASNILKGFDAPYQSTAIELLEAEGAICIAKANLDAFAHGSSTENSDFMTTLNPHDSHRVAGGSSGGSAAAVALDIVPFALGSDTGGSIRLPASFCGVVGYKPTYGLVSRSGVVAMASSTDVIGPLARNVEDVAIVLDCIAGKDELDGTTIERDAHSYVSKPKNLDGLKVGIIKEYFGEGLEPGVKNAVEAAITKIKEAGADIEYTSLPSLSLALACYYVLCPAEVSSNLSRYDGQRYGYSDPNAKTLEESYIKSRSIGFGDEAKRRIMIGTYVLSSGYYDAYYQQAQLVRTKIINDFKTAFQKYDILVGPTAPTVPFKVGEHSNDPLEMYLVDIMTAAVNLAGNPAISIPCARIDGLPVGLQIIGAQTADREVLSVARSVEEILV